MRRREFITDYQSYEFVKEDYLNFVKNNFINAGYLRKEKKPLLLSIKEMLREFKDPNFIQDLLPVASTFFRWHPSWKERLDFMEEQRSCSWARFLHMLKSIFICGFLLAFLLFFIDKISPSSISGSQSLLREGFESFKLTNETFLLFIILIPTIINAVVISNPDSKSLAIAINIIFSNSAFIILAVLCLDFIIHYNTFLLEPHSAKIIKIIIFTVFATFSSWLLVNAIRNLPFKIYIFVILCFFLGFISAVLLFGEERFGLHIASMSREYFLLLTSFFWL